MSRLGELSCAGTLEPFWDLTQYIFEKKPGTSVMSTRPTGRPERSITGNSLIFRSDIKSIASIAIDSERTAQGRFVMYEEIGSSRGTSPCSNNRARSESVKTPVSAPSPLTSIIAPVLRPGSIVLTKT